MAVDVAEPRVEQGSVVARRCAATTWGSGRVCFDLGVFGSERERWPGASWQSTRTARRRKSTWQARMPSSSPIRSPSPAGATTIARLRTAAVFARARTCSTVSGTTRSRSYRGSCTRTTGDEATRRSSTADA
ncbi:MAG: hypothetical protein ACRDMV_19220 [Streptosporangiales bacterium]